MQHDSRLRFALLQAGNASHMIQMSMRASNHLEFESMFVDSANDALGVVSRIDTKRSLRLFATQNAGVLLEGRYGDLFDDHLPSGFWSLVFGLLGRPDP